MYIPLTFTSSFDTISSVVGNLIISFLSVKIPPELIYIGIRAAICLFYLMKLKDLIEKDANRGQVNGVNSGGFHGRCT